MASSLLIRELELQVLLGWAAIERQKTQTVVLDLAIHFLKPPEAVATDKLEDTVCYALLVKHIRDSLSEKKFHLIEHLSHEIYKVVESFISVEAKINVSITKRPHISGLMGGTRFTYGNEL
ncbi:MAG: hypothetical protein A3F12_03160 [Gammaproteobacteria bacterium RIFCSPHIGHO2_12_FULL_38_14]|nr:MAG: hypothetical protein A3F12_03160 [Gammaproteobacteria bacterium RIFCSPHIGHO2_12_FULL_38_14]